MNINNYYLKKIKIWKKSLSKDEWFFVNVRKKITENCSPNEAFNAIPYILRLLLDTNEHYLLTENLQLIIDLARHSDTTEIPKLLDSSWNELNNKIKDTDKYTERKLIELARWYRKVI